MEGEWPPYTWTFKWVPIFNPKGWWINTLKPNHLRQPFLKVLVCPYMIYSKPACLMSVISLRFQPRLLPRSWVESCESNTCLGLKAQIFGRFQGKKAAKITAVSPQASQQPWHLSGYKPQSRLIRRFSTTTSFGVSPQNSENMEKSPLEAFLGGPWSRF